MPRSLRRVTTGLVLLLGPLVWFAVVIAQAPAARYDVIIRHGTVLDGTGAPRSRADVAIAGGSIARVGDLEGA